MNNEIQVLNGGVLFYVLDISILNLSELLFVTQYKTSRTTRHSLAYIDYARSNLDRVVSIQAIYCS